MEMLRVTCQHGSGHLAGVGKTLQAIALASCDMPTWRPLLVICPASLRLTWADELDKWLPDLPPSQIHIVDSGDKWRPDVFGAGVVSVRGGPPGHRPLCAEVAGASDAAVDNVAQPASRTCDGSSDAAAGNAGSAAHATEDAAAEPRDDRHVVVVSYHLLPAARCGACKEHSRAQGKSGPAPCGSETSPACAGWPHCISDARFPWVIVDESHRLQSFANDEPLMSVLAQRVISQSDKAVLLSGTPSVSRPFDLCSQLHALQPQRFGNEFKRFKNAFGFR